MTSYLRDRITANFDYKPGDLVRMKADSSIVIVTDIILGGNDYNYFLKFLIKNKKGESITIRNWNSKQIISLIYGS